jgi:3-oxoacyl-[acyl-carrier protein] reductase
VIIAVSARYDLHSTESLDAVAPRREHFVMPVALVTGGTRGIGLGIATRLAAEGWELALNGVRDEAEVREPLDALRAGGTQVIYARGDVAFAADREQIIATTVDRLGRIDALVNNAGITSVGRRDLLEATEESWDRVFGVNLKGPFFLTQLVARQMLEQGDAADFSRTIVNVSSVSAEFVSTNRGDYCITKAAIGMATRLWAARLGEHGIAVYEVRPGVVESDMTAGVTEKYDRLIADGLTLDPRWGTPDDVGRAVATLLRGDVPYATGQVLRIDGGMTIHRL